MSVVKSILIVDDEPELLKILQQEIAPLGRVIVAKDGVEGTFKFNNQKFDLIITDNRMPRMGGIEFIANIRKKNEEVPILMISGFDSEIPLSRKYEFMAKPYNSEALFTRAKKLLEEGHVTAPPKSEIISLKAGDTLFKEGDKGQDAYYIKSGQLSIYKNVDGKQIFISNLDKGELVGELSLITGENRSATVLANSDAELSIITKAMLAEEIDKLPKWHKIFSRIIVDRLVKTTADYSLLIKKTSE